MNIHDILNLKPGTLFKGIDNRHHKAILSLDGWKNSEKGSYIIRWFNETQVDEKKYSILNHQNMTCETRLELFNQYPPSFQKNLRNFENQNQYESFELKHTQIGYPIGMFLGQSILCISGATLGIVLLKILDATKIGWIVLGCKDMHLPNQSFEIY